MTKEKDISKMETLTQQWKNRRLKTGHYYFKTKDNVKIGFIYEGFRCPYDGKYNTIDDVVEVLAPIPTYEEWEELQESNDGLSKLMFKSLMDRFVKADEERERLEEENTELVTKCHRLEKLLKRCRDSVEFDKREALGGGADYQAKILSALLKEIDEVLG